VNFSKEFKVGLLAVTCFVLVYYGFHFLKGVDFFSPAHQYIVVYDKVDGLVESNPVQINGLKVGKVREIRLAPEIGHKLAVTIDIDRSIDLNDKTVAYLSSAGVLGPKCIVLEVNQGTRILKKDDSLQAGKIDDMMTMVQKKATPMLDSLDKVMGNINSLMAEYTGMSTEIRKILANTQSLTASFNGIAADNRQSIKTTMDNAAKISTSLAESQKKIEPLMSKMNTFADSLNALRLAATVNKANGLMTELNKTMTAINSQKGSAGKLIYNDSLYTTLNKSLLSLDSLLVDFRKSPKRYVHFSLFGRKDKK
jgi:phospholipid/cholesterol/gamma-HCH transport system substrate-binding protein